MKRIVLVVTLFVLAVGIAPTLSLAHCGKKHESEGRVFVAQLSHKELAYELKGLETPPDVAALEKSIEQAENADLLDQLIRDLMIDRCQSKSKDVRTKKKAD